MDKKQVSDVLDEIAILLEIKGENPFKSRAYMMAARTVLSQSNEPSELVASGEIRKIKGIGSALADKITELVETGRLPYYDKLKASIPAGLLEMTGIPGFGPKKIKKVYDDLGVATVAELEAACQDKRLAGLPGFGEKTQEKILQGIQFLRQHAGRHLYHRAEAAALPLLEAIRNHPKVIRAEIGGSLRRRKETIKDIDIVASAAHADADEIMTFFTSHVSVATVTGSGTTKSSVLLQQGISADLRIMPDDKYPYILHHFTGSAEHNTAMRTLARKKGMKVSEHGIFDRNNKLIPCRDESDIFATLDLVYIPPELREDTGEIEAAADNAIPGLVELSDLRGILHSHSTFSDGANTVAEMVAATQAMGYTYFGLCDHSQIVVYARGLQPERLIEQHAVVDDLNMRNPDCRILKGTECDILNDGSLDYSDDILATLDFVVASIHSNIGMSKADATRRIIRAIEHPLVDIIGHPTGRILLGRDGYPLDMHKVVDAAAENQVSMELNASPHRFDIDWRYCRYAKEKGVLISINPDAHSVDGLADMRYGVGIARKGWLEKENILNAMTLEEIESYFRKKR
jgi:DNA polymerase (family 10)